MARSAISQRRFTPRQFNNSVIHTQTNGDHITTGDAWDSTTEDATFHLWLKWSVLAADSSNQHILAHTDGTGSGNSLAFQSNTGNRILTNYGTGINNVVGTISDFNKHLLSMTFDISENIALWYIDGVLKYTGDLVNEGANGAMRIGSNKGGSQSLNGKTSQFLFFKRVQGAAEIADYYFDNIIDQTNLTNWLEYTDGSGTTVTATIGSNATIVDLLWDTIDPFKQRAAISQARSAISQARSAIT